MRPTSLHFSQCPRDDLARPYSATNLYEGFGIGGSAYTRTVPAVGNDCLRVAAQISPEVSQLLLVGVVSTLWERCAASA